MASTPLYTPVKSKCRKLSNIRLHKCLFKPNESSASNLGEKVMAFMLSDDNSFQCLDKKKENVHYRKDTLEVLHEKLMAEENIDGSYCHSCHYIPEEIVKPGPEDWGTSLCKTCLNPELKVEALKTSNDNETGVTIDWLLSLNKKEQKE